MIEITDLRRQEMVKCINVILLWTFVLLAVILFFTAGALSKPPRDIAGMVILLFVGTFCLGSFYNVAIDTVGSGRPRSIDNLPNDTAYRIKAKLSQTGENNNKGVMGLTDKDGPNNKFFLIKCDDLSLFPDSVKFVKVQDSELMPYSFEE